MVEVEGGARSVPKIRITEKHLFRCGNKLGIAWSHTLEKERRKI